MKLYTNICSDIILRRIKILFFFALICVFLFSLRQSTYSFTCVSQWESDFTYNVKDKSVYRIDFSWTCSSHKEIYKIPWVSYDNFFLYSNSRFFGYHAYDWENVYRKNKIISWVDIETFWVLHPYFSYDKNNLYYDGEVLDADSFRKFTVQQNFKEDNYENIKFIIENIISNRHTTSGTYDQLVWKWYEQKWDQIEIISNTDLSDRIGKILDEDSTSENIETKNIGEWVNEPKSVNFAYKSSIYLISLLLLIGLLLWFFRQYRK